MDAMHNCLGVDDVTTRSKEWGRFSVVGHSLGGAVAMFIAGTFPELIERCVFIDALGPIMATVGSSPKLLRRSIESRRENQDCWVSLAALPCEPLPDA